MAEVAAEQAAAFLAIEEALDKAAAEVFGTGVQQKQLEDESEQINAQMIYIRKLFDDSWSARDEKQEVLKYEFQRLTNAAPEEGAKFLKELADIVKHRQWHEKATRHLCYDQLLGHPIISSFETPVCDEDSAVAWLNEDSGEDYTAAEWVAWLNEDV